jgi:hypothetical protein
MLCKHFGAPIVPGDESIILWDRWGVPSTNHFSHVKDEVVSLDQGAKCLGMKVQRLKQAVREKRIEPVVMGRAMGVTIGELSRFLNSLPLKGRKPEETRVADA